MVEDPHDGAPSVHHVQPWAVVLGLFLATVVVEAVCLSQLFAFMPMYLLGLGLPAPDVPRWVGILNSLVFVLGLPLVPLWGVWADKYSRKAVILRSAVVEAAVLALIGLSRQPWQLALSFLLAGFQFGNTGVMLSTLRDITPRRRLSTTLAVMGAGWPVGSALGPALGGLLVDGFRAPLSSVYLLAAALSVGVALMLAVGLQEVRPPDPPVGRTVDLAFGALRGVFADVATRRIFGLFGVVFLASQMTNPFVPLLVARVHDSQAGLASAVALVVGTAALVGGLISPLGGAIADRVGIRRVLVVSMLGSSLVLALMPSAPGVSWLAALSVARSALGAVGGAMFFALLATEVPAERRSATLNLVYLPLYLTGVVGPALGALVVAAGLPVVFLLGGAALGLVGIAAARSGGR